MQSANKLASLELESTLDQNSVPDAADPVVLNAFIPTTTKTDKGKNTNIAGNDDDVDMRHFGIRPGS